MPPLTYTTEPPTQPGWYWLRLPKRKPLCVEVSYTRVGTLRVDGTSRAGVVMSSWLVADFPAGTQWAGPIPRPVEA